MQRIPLTYLAQVRRTRRNCAFLSAPYHHRFALTMPRYLRINATAGSTEFRKVVVILGLAHDAELCERNKNMDALSKALGLWRKTIKFGSSRLHVVVAKLRAKRLIMDMDNGRINCWMLGDYRVSVLIRSGRMCRSQNVKREGIRTRTYSRRFAPWIFSHIAGGKSASHTMDTRVWRGYRPTVLATSSLRAFGLAWAKNMTSRQQEKSKPLAVTWLNIYLRTTFLTPHGLKTGGEYVTLNPFLNSQNKLRMLSFYSNEMTGINWRALQSWYLQENPML